MSEIEGCVHDFEYVVEKLGVSENAAALLVVAANISAAATFGKYKAENFGHELAMALKHVFERSTVRVDVGGNITTEVSQ